jgi:hypothetical protein
MHENHRATAPKYGLRGFDLLDREALRIRIQRHHEVWSESEPVAISASRLPEAETGLTQHVIYRGDGRIPDDILGYAPAGGD